MLTGQDGTVWFKPAGTSVCLRDNSDFPAGTAVKLPNCHGFIVGDVIEFAEEDGGNLDTASPTQLQRLVVFLVRLSSLLLMTQPRPSSSPPRLPQPPASPLLVTAVLAPRTILCLRTSMCVWWSTQWSVRLQTSVFHSLETKSKQPACLAKLAQMQAAWLHSRQSNLALLMAPARWKSTSHRNKVHSQTA